MKLKNPIREIRKAMTPPCTQCVHSRYKAVGNSMAVPVMRWIGERIAMAEAGEIA